MASMGPSKYGSDNKTTQIIVNHFWFVVLQFFPDEIGAVDQYLSWLLIPFGC